LQCAGRGASDDGPGAESNEASPLQSVKRVESYKGKKGSSISRLTSGVGDFIATHSTPVALREGILYVRVLQPALHYELEQVSKIDILRKLKRRFGPKTIRDVRFRVG
jgi:hypothetical protein